MSWIKDRYHELAALVRRDPVEHDVAEEFEHHLALLTEANIAAGMTPEEHRRAFGTFVAALLADFDRWADAGAAAPGGLDAARDGVGYRMTCLWLDDDEFAALVDDVREVLRSRLGNEPGGRRRRRLLGTVFLPG